MRRLYYCVGGFLVAGLAVAVSTSVHFNDAQAEAKDAPEPQWEATYAFSGGTRERGALEDAIEKVVLKMPSMVQDTARSKLAESNPVISRLSFDLDHDPLVSSYIGGRIISAPADGSSVSWVNPMGDRVRVRARYDGSVLHQTMEAVRGKRTNVYRFKDDTMVMQVRIESHLLPDVLEYQLTYERVR